jgi:formylglycine-generating enzyme required for sulfatase activity
VNKLVAQHNRDVAAKQANAPTYRLPKSSTRFPTGMEWDYAAYGTANPTYSADWLNRQKEVIHSTFSTERIDLLDMRTTPSGIADMLGQVWEWCDGDNRLSFAVLGEPEDGNQEVRGGAFLDNLFKFRGLPVLKATLLKDKVDTHHSDVGFRIAVEISFADLSGDEQAKVAGFPPIFQ